MFYTNQKNFQSQYVAKNWQKTLQKREMIRNNYRVTGDIKKAKIFVDNIMNYTPHTHFVSHGEHIIFSSDMVTLPLKPAYAFAKG